MVRRHEGDASERIELYWLDHRHDAFLAFRSAAGRLRGFLAFVLLDEPHPQDCEADPAVAAAWQLVRRSGFPRPSERLWQMRFWMSRDGYHDGPCRRDARGRTWTNALVDDARPGVDLPCGRGSGLLEVIDFPRAVKRIST